MLLLLYNLGQQNRTKERKPSFLQKPPPKKRVAIIIMKFNIFQEKKTNNRKKQASVLMGLVELYFVFLLFALNVIKENLLKGNADLLQQVCCQ